MDVCFHIFTNKTLLYTRRILSHSEGTKTGVFTLRFSEMPLIFICLRLESDLDQRTRHSAIKTVQF